MKRRTFLTTTGMVGAGLSTGFAATTSILTASSNLPGQLSGLTDGHQHLLASFAKEISNHTVALPSTANLKGDWINPIEIISLDEDGKKVCYKNAAANYIRLEQKKNGLQITVHESLSHFAD